jgi:fermentation-respiration switch protein FrsA (DUF1100 family)
MSTTPLILGLAGFYLLGPKVVLWGLLFALICCVWLIVNQESVLYVPVIQGIKTVRDNPSGMRSPTERGMKYEDVWMHTPDGEKIHGWYIPSSADEATAPTVLFLHANAGNLGLRIDLFEKLNKVVKVNLLAIDYRGYGDSTGTPSEDGLITDAECGLGWLLKRARDGVIDGSKVFIFGRSLGGAVSISLAEKIQDEKPGEAIRGIIIENTFTSISEMMDSQFPWLAWDIIKKAFLRLKWDSITKVAKVRFPFLLIAGGKDELIPHHQMLRIAKTAQNAQLEIVPEGGHNDTWSKGGTQYWKWVAEFVAAHENVRPTK